MLEVLRGWLETSDEEQYEVSAEELASIGAQMGLSRPQSVRLFKDLVHDGLVRVSPTSRGEMFLEYGNEFGFAWMDGLTAAGKRLIGVLPAVDSVEGVVASLEELAQQIRESQILSPEEKDQQVRALRTLMGDLRQAGVGIGAQVLLQYLARGLSG